LARSSHAALKNQLKINIFMAISIPTVKHTGETAATGTMEFINVSILFLHRWYAVQYAGIEVTGLTTYKPYRMHSL
jgi:hypothetical protein